MQQNGGNHARTQIRPPTSRWVCSTQINSEMKYEQTDICICLRYHTKTKL